MAQQVTTISPLFSTPYLTIAEYKQAPTAVDVDDLVGGGSASLNDRELTNVIARASSWIDSHCNQVISATQDTESFRARVSRDGMLKLHPRYWPVVSVVSASFGSLPSAMQTLDVSTAWIEPMAIVFPLVGNAASFLGGLQFSKVYSSTVDQFVTLTYVNGYANTLLSTSSLAAATSLIVADRTGFMPIMSFMIYDGVSSETVTISSSFTPTVGAGSVTLAAGCVYAHSAGISLSGLPPAVKQAAIYMTNVILKSRGSQALVMGGLSPSQMISSNEAASSDYRSACDLLAPYRRIR